MNQAHLTLTSFGFTELEASLYAELLKHAPATGYRLSRSVGKATANTYQALDSLARKGAVIADEAEPRSYRPVPPDELFAVLRRAFLAQSDVAERELSALYEPSAADHLYHLKTLPQAMERASKLIDESKVCLLFDLFPKPMAFLHEALTRAHERGVRIGGLVYGPCPPSPFVTEEAPGAPFVSERWPGSQMTLISDAREVLLVLIDHDGESIKTGFWSDSNYLACLHHSGLASEMRLSAALREGGDPLRDFGLLSAAPPGLRHLTSQSVSSVRTDPDL